MCEVAESIFPISIRMPIFTYKQKSPNFRQNQIRNLESSLFYRYQHHIRNSSKCRYSILSLWISMDLSFVSVKKCNRFSENRAKNRKKVLSFKNMCRANQHRRLPCVTLPFLQTHAYDGRWSSPDGLSDFF